MTNPGDLGVAPTTAQPYIRYNAHLASTGTVGFRNQPDVIGTTGETRGLEALLIEVMNGPNLVVRGICKPHAIAVQEERINGQWMGTQGQGHHLEWLQLWLTGNDASRYSIYYRVYLSGSGWSPTVMDGAQAGALEQRIEAFAGWIAPKG